MGVATDKGGLGCYKSKIMVKRVIKLEQMLELLQVKEPKWVLQDALVNALTAPLMDVLRPSRKENVIGNMRPMGNAFKRWSHE